jgi:hypothetical protein
VTSRFVNGWCVRVDLGVISRRLGRRLWRHRRHFREASSRIAAVRSAPSLARWFAVLNQRGSPHAQIGERPFPLNDAEARNIAANGELPARENRARMPVRQIVQAQLSRGSSFIAMLGRDPHSSTLGQERDQWSSMFSNCTARAVRSSPSPSSLWRRARLTGHPMIELPHQFLNAIFAAVIVVANVRRSRNRLRGSPDVRERS